MENEKAENKENTEKNEVVEQTTETENTGTAPAEKKEEKVFTQEEMNKISRDRAYRAEQRVRREYDQKYSKLNNVLNAGLGSTNVDEATQKLTDFYKEQGVEIPTEAKLTPHQEKMLAKAEAQEVINQGYDEVVGEIDRLNSKTNMNSYEKEMFNQLVQAKTKQDDLKDLKSIGVGEDVLEDKEFQKFSKKLNPSLSLKEKYEMYSRFKKPKKIETIGSMKSNEEKDNDIKENYTYEEAKKFTKEQLMKNPKLMEKIQASAATWK